MTFNHARMKPTTAHTQTTDNETNSELVLVRPTSHKGCGSLTTVIQQKVVLGVAVLLWATGYEHVIVPKEVLQAGYLRCGGRVGEGGWVRRKKIF